MTIRVVIRKVIIRIIEVMGSIRRFIPCSKKKKENNHDHNHTNGRGSSQPLNPLGLKPRPSRGLTGAPEVHFSRL